jgi:hypothetical protein
MALDRYARYGQQDPGEPQTSDELIARGKRRRDGGGGSSSDRKPLGVPAGYTATVERSWTPSPGRSGRVNLAAGRYMAEQGPRYFTGDEWKPAQRPTGSIVAMQQALVVAGYIGADDSFLLGVWDTPTRKAYSRLLEDANAACITDEAMLTRAAQGMPIGGGGSGGQGGGGGTHIDPRTGEVVEDQYMPPPLALQVPNFEDSRKVIRSAVIDKLGQGWSQQQIDDLARDYQWRVMQSQTDAYRQETQRGREIFEAGRSDLNQITTVAAPTAQTFAEEEAQRRDPGGYQAAMIANDFAPAFFEAVGAGGIY